MMEALFYQKKPRKSVQCYLCPRQCLIADGKRGVCGVRENGQGTLYSLVYSKPCSLNVDPIEKKPLYHFAPGTKCLSVATVGCNLLCKFCQNWEISRALEISGTKVEPEKIIEVAKQNKSPGIAYTYTEPTIFFEYAIEVMKLARREKLYNVWVSNGYTGQEALEEAAKYMDAINVDLKGDAGFYKKMCSVQDTKPIYEGLKAYKKAGVWIETTTLVIPGLNDSERQISQIANWVKSNLGPETPMHFSKFFPCYKLSHLKSTPPETVEKAASIAEKAGMRYVYVGNMPSSREHTYCPKCREIAVRREGYSVKMLAGRKGKCRKCGTEIPLKGMKWAMKRKSG
jgi:pyruvate formate lyase activating enzyme